MIITGIPYLSIPYLTTIPYLSHYGLSDLFGVGEIIHFPNKDTKTELYGYGEFLVINFTSSIPVHVCLFFPFQE